LLLTNFIDGLAFGSAVWRVRAWSRSKEERKKSTRPEKRKTEKRKSGKAEKRKSGKAENRKTYPTRLDQLGILGQAIFRYFGPLSGNNSIHYSRDEIHLGKKIIPRHELP
jgi:hypothetical protein